MKEYRILEKGIYGKVLVEWTRQQSDFYPEGKEYSVHTVGFHGGLVWGHYFKTLDEAKEYFKQYKIDSKFSITRLYEKERNLLVSREEDINSSIMYFQVIDLNKNEYIETKVIDIAMYDLEEITEEQFLDMLSKTSFEICPVTKCLCI